jgi:ubiquitin-protein ligase E3 C
LTPDDEFFTPSTNPLLVDEVLDLSLIWRDLAFWGYMHGVSGNPEARNAMTNIPHGAGSEEERSLFTRGVTRVAERK